MHHSPNSAIHQVDTRRADPAILADVNTAILDYLMYAAMKALLGDLCALQQSNLEMLPLHRRANVPLQLIESFLIISNPMHTAYHQDQNLQFRMRLLKFSALFAQWKHPLHLWMTPEDVQEFRRTPLVQSNAFRSGKWEETNSDLLKLRKHLASPGETMHIKQEMVDSTTHNTTPYQDDEQPSGSNQLPPISLLDLLPHFMALSAAQIALQGHLRITDTWMRLAAAYMIQAVAEQYLVYDSARSDVLYKTFAWGFDEDTTAEEGTDDYFINVMFWDEEAEGPNARWEEIRDQHIRGVSKREPPILRLAPADSGVSLFRKKAPVYKTVCDTYWPARYQILNSGSACAHSLKDYIEAKGSHCWRKLSVGG
ncbi:MAG: hypothetical protein Q9163_005082 [Psora crenata]